jgi:hypothetical protein
MVRRPIYGPIPLKFNGRLGPVPEDQRIRAKSGPWDLRFTDTRETGRSGRFLGWSLLALVPVGLEALAVLVLGHLFTSLLDERSHG